MAGTANRKRGRSAGYTPSEYYVAACRELSTSLGYRMGDVVERFCFLVLVRQQIQKMPPEVAEWAAFRDTCAIHDKRGARPS